MKLLLGLLVALAGAAAILSGTAALGLLYGGGIVAGWTSSGREADFWSGMLVALLGCATILGLACAIGSCLLGLLTALINLIRRCWIQAAICILICLSGAGLWIFFVLRPAE